MGKFINLTLRATLWAQKSETRCAHGAIILSGSHVIAGGCSNYADMVDGQCVCAMHAEQAALRKLYKGSCFLRQQSKVERGEE